jgi:hypothetical protein
MEKLCTNKNRSYKHNEQINKQNIDNSECFGVKFVKIYPEITFFFFFFFLKFFFFFFFFIKYVFFFTFPKTFDR